MSHQTWDWMFSKVEGKVGKPKIIIIQQNSMPLKTVETPTLLSAKLHNRCSLLHHVLYVTGNVLDCMPCVSEEISDGTPKASDNLGSRSGTSAVQSSTLHGHCGRTALLNGSIKQSGRWSCAVPARSPPATIALTATETVVCPVNQHSASSAFTCREDLPNANEALQLVSDLWRQDLLAVVQNGLRRWIVRTTTRQGGIILAGALQGTVNG